LLACYLDMLLSYIILQYLASPKGDKRGECVDNSGRAWGAWLSARNQRRAGIVARIRASLCMYSCNKKSTTPVLLDALSLFLPTPRAVVSLAKQSFIFFLLVFPFVFGVWGSHTT